MNKHTMKLVALSLVAAASLGGCIIFDESKCEAVPSMAAPTRNPYTGECESPGWDGDYDCQAYPQGTTSDTPQDDTLAPGYGWGACYSQCEALDEATCTATSGCQAAYAVKDIYEEGDAVEGTFWGCWATAENYLSSMQACDTLIAETCTMRDDCSPVYSDLFSQKTEPAMPPPQHSFLSCRAELAEVGCYSDDDCGEGFDCTADTECLSPPGCDDGMVCPTVCYGTCVPNEPPPLPGNCYTLNVCEVEPPACPEGTLPGIANGCWTGYCIPLNACESPACGALDEATCQSASACEPVYEGSDCTCNASGCECNTLTYAYCVDA